MNQNTKIELANEIMIAMVGNIIRNGLSKESKIYKNILTLQVYKRS